MEKNLEIKYYEKDDARFATPKEIADFRAKKLECNRIVDLCCGVGSQTLAFGKTCKHILGIELNKRKTSYAKRNCNLDNIKIIHGDVLSEKIINLVREFKPEIIFCDTERPKSEEEREIGNIKPDLSKLISIYSKICKNLCIEIPPQIELEKLQNLGKFEAEYISYKNKLNRLELNFGKLCGSKKSAVDVSGAKIYGKNVLVKEIAFPLNYIYDVSGAIVKAELEGELADKINAKILSKEKGKVLLTSEKLAENDYANAFTKKYLVLGFANSFSKVRNILKEKNIGKVVLRINISPEDYWKKRKIYEEDLKGDKEVNLFSYNEKGKIIFIVAESIDIF